MSALPIIIITLVAIGSTIGIVVYFAGRFYENERQGVESSEDLQRCMDLYIKDFTTEDVGLTEFGRKRLIELYTLSKILQDAENRRDNSTEPEDDSSSDF